jgi:acyl transferase domain-containing protein/thioester reductase-like protein/acyl carrier protein
VANARKATSFVFGGHIGPQTKQTLEKQVRHMMEGPNAKWILETVAGLPQYWEAVIEKIPEMDGTMQGARLLADLESWFRHGAASEDSIAPDAVIPDIWIGPLMIAIQLDQYWRYLAFRSSSSTRESVDDLQAELVQQHQQSAGSGKVETVGFCAGMIAAVAVASSHDRREFEQYGAAALRIGMMMAALVGACEEWDKGLGKGGSVSLATAWRTPKQGNDMARIVSSMSPNAYISVIFDEARATVTTSERLAPKLVRQLRAAGVTAIPLAFKGQLHTPGAERERHTNALIDICHAMPELQFPDAARLALPTYIDHPEGKPVSAEEVDLIGMVLRSILANQLNWSSTVSKLGVNRDDVSLIAFGLDRPMPPTILRRFGPKQVHFEDVEDQIPKLVAPPQAAPQSNDIVNSSEVLAQSQAAEPSRPSAKLEQDPEDVIAIVGMSLKVAGADDLEEFGDMLKTGASQHQVITRERMTPDMLFREGADADPKRTWYGNFMRDSDAFDHKFFKRSPRESKAIDPQGRHSMQAAYQAVEQSGYFNDMATTSKAEHERRKHVGVYVGLCSFEYEINMICHPTSAFTATGGLRSFIPGRVSHYFGWTGPAMTFDTACSSSTVALHSACRDLLSGEVSAALCGGVNVLTNLQWTQNLAAGSFISPSGQCKPFDTDADGYCRGDGIAYVFLKKLSTAIADGNPILGTIRATGVNQNHNSTPLFVPNVPSLSTLFKDVIRKARVDPREISLVECHGTGTPVGDPAEYESIRQAVAGPLRDTVVPIGSVKGHVGHTEGASGIVSLIKVLTMMRGDFIPAQASFNIMNPHIHSKPADMMEVVTSLRPWQGDSKVALINNYGACGSNASVVVAHTAHKPAKALSAATPRYPFWMSGLDARSIAAYSTVLAPYLRSHAGTEEGLATLADVSFNMKRQSNPNLAQGLIFSCSSLAELQDKLSQAASASSAASIGIAPIKPERPVILCFGGQVSTFIGLDRALYDGAAVLRHHLDRCNVAIMAHGLDSIYPDIFSCEPIKDVVKLQTALFAMQYASAKSWIDCGLTDKVVSLVGHSFGEITALCVAGVLSLEDTVKLIAGRAKLVQEAWGPDPGAMMAIEADEAVVNDILKEANLASDGSAGIACYNGVRSFTLAGSTQAIDAFARTLAARSSSADGIKSKRLNVTNAFHSALVESLSDRLGEVGKALTFHDAVIPIERATEHGDPAAPLDWSFVGSHMRQPVFFNHAVQRLVSKHPQAIFLEAGSNSTVTVMAARALAQAASTTADALHFQSVSITNTKKGIDGLTDATVALWKQGLRVSFWAHNPVQTGDYAQLLLPPYQFEKSRHWLELKSPKEEIIKAAEKMIASGSIRQLAGGAATPEEQEQVDPKTLPLWTFVGFQDELANKGSSTKKKAKLARFRINTASDKYMRLFATHVIAQTAPICPATLEIDMAIETVFSLNPDWRLNNFSPVVRDMISHSAICADSTRVHYIDLEALNKAETEWHFTIHSVGASTAAISEKHAEGRIQMCSPSDPSFVQEFGRYERVVSHAQCRAVLQLGPGDEGVEALQGRNVYRAFESVVDFGPVYHGVRSVVGRDGESAGVVHKRHGGDTWLDVPKADSFGQVAGMYVNLLTDLPSGDMFVATGLEMTMRSPTAQTVTDGEENGPGVWHVLARHTRQSDKAYVTDIFIFDAATGALAEVILGLRYVRVAKATMSKILARVTKDKSFVRTTTVSQSSSISSPATVHKSVEAASRGQQQSQLQPRLNAKAKRANIKKTKPSSRRDIAQEVINVVASVSGIEVSDMNLDSEMADMGIDSLMGMELAREVENTFKCTLDAAEQMEATNLRQFIACVSNTLARSGGGEDVEQEDDDDDDDDDNENDTYVETTRRRPQQSQLQSRSHSKAKRASSKKRKPSSRRDIAEEVINVVASVSGIEIGDMNLDSEMADMGIDSLMGMELAREVENTFKCTLDAAEQMEATNLRQFIACVANTLARAGGREDVQQESDDDSDDDSAAAAEGDVVFSDRSQDEDTDSDISTPDDASDFASKSLVPSSLLAQASTSNSSAAAAKGINRGDVAAREAEAERLVVAYTAGWDSPALEAAANRTTSTHTGGAVVIVTGASGSLGSHLVQTLAERPDVATVVCMNRPVSNMSADKRQADSLSSRGIQLSPAARSKLRVYDTNTTKPQLGLPAQEYAWLAQNGTHIIHNAWPMSGTRALKAYEPQIRVMRSLLDLAREMAITTAPRRIGFQYVSSIGVVGFSDETQVLEQPVPMAAVMTGGYNEGKWVCERMLSETLRRHPKLFRAAVARPGQISGSTTSGVWNPVEHFAFLVKSAQALKAWPDLRGVLHWLPVDRSAGVMVDLLKLDSRDDTTVDMETYPVYHIDNPVGQPWKDMSTVMAAALDIPSHGIIPFEDWIKRVRQSPLSETENPAIRAIEFLEGHFRRMACGGIILDTQRASEHSRTMAAEGPVSAKVVRSYVSTWKSLGFLDK